MRSYEILPDQERFSSSSSTIYSQNQYVFTGVIITSLFNDVSDKTVLYLLGMLIVFVTLLLGLSLTTKKKDK